MAQKDVLNLFRCQKPTMKLWLNGWHFELQYGFETNNDSALHGKNMWHVYRQT